jgi:hypothetical protein
VLEHVTVVAGEDDDPPGVARRFEQPAQGQDAARRPLHPELLAAGQVIVDRVDHHAHDPMVARNRSLQVLLEPALGCPDGALVEQDRRLTPGAGPDQGLVLAERLGLVLRGAARELPREQARTRERS